MLTLSLVFIVVGHVTLVEPCRAINIRDSEEPQQKPVHSLICSEQMILDHISEKHQMGRSGQSLCRATLTLSASEAHTTTGNCRYLGQDIETL